MRLTASAEDSNNNLNVVVVAHVVDELRRLQLLHQLRPWPLQQQPEQEQEQRL